MDATSVEGFCFRLELDLRLFKLEVLLNLLLVCRSPASIGGNLFLRVLSLQEALLGVVSFLFALLLNTDLSRWAWIRLSWDLRTEVDLLLGLGPQRFDHDFIIFRNLLQVLFRLGLDISFHYLIILVNDRFFRLWCLLLRQSLILLLDLFLYFSQIWNRWFLS